MKRLVNIERAIVIVVAILMGLLLVCRATTFAGSYTYTIIAADGDTIDGKTLDLKDQTSLSYPYINDSGDIAFCARLSEGGAGIFTQTDAVALPGDIIDGKTIDIFYGTTTSPAINNSGIIVFKAGYPGGYGIFTQSDAVALQGDMIGGKIITAFSGLPTINDSGIVAFRAKFSGGSGIFTQSDAVALPGDTIGGKTLTGFSEIPIAIASVNDSGVVTFRGEFSGGSGIFTQSHAFALPGDTIGGKILTGLFGSPSINNLGDIAFSALFSGGAGIFTQSGAVALTGDTIGGETINGFPFASTPSINDYGDVVFEAGYSGVSGIFTQSDAVALWGDTIDGKVLNGLWAGPSSINNSGQVAFLARFSDTTYGILLADPVLLTVTKTTDTFDGICDADCSLRDAIATANASPGTDTIILPAGTYTLSITGMGEDGAATGDLDVTDHLIIRGRAASSTIIDGNGIDRVFHIIESSGFGITVEVSGVTIQNGRAEMGGGIFNNQSGLVTITYSSISNNSAGSGGGIFNSSIASMDLHGITVTGNDATGPGGGGIFNLGTMTLTNTTVSGNVASSILTNGGSGITNTGTLTLLNTTIHNNTVYPNLTGGDGTIDNSGTVNLKNSIVWANSGVVCFGAGTYSSSGHNLTASDCGLTGPGDINLNPLLGPLQDNGGPTFTHALLTGSPAIDTGENIGCPHNDQRGVIRPQDGDGDGSMMCDIGAYELELIQVIEADLAVTKTDSPDPVIVGNDLTYELEVTNNGPDHGTGVALTDTLPDSVAFISATPSQGICNESGGTVTCDLGTIANGSSAAVTLVVTPLAEGQITNTANVYGKENDPDGTNNSATESTGVLPANSTLLLIEPNGGEVIPSGSTYTIQWLATLEAVSFKLKYSVNNGRTWKPIDTGITDKFYDWTVPTPVKNKTKCLVKVIGYDDSDKKVGADRSDSTFTIEVVKVTYPNGGELLTSGDQHTITWTTNETKRPVEKVVLKYTKNGGTTWEKITAIEGSNPGRHSWTVPDVSEAKWECLVKVVLKDAKGNTVGSDTSNSYFRIEPFP